MNKRNLGVVSIVLLLLGVILSGCSSQSYDQEIYGDLENLDPSEQVITYWYQHTGDREQALQALIADFNATNEWSITAHGEYAGSYDEIYNKIIDGTSTGEIPEIAVAYQNQAATYVTLDAIVELTPYIESPNWGFSEEEYDDFFPFVALGDYLPEYDGRYGFPPQRSMEVLYYNSDWMQELGYSQPPRTWEEFKDMACAASDPTKGTFGYEFDVDASTFADMLFNRGGTIFNQDASTYTFGDQAGLEVLTFLQDLFAQGCAIQETEGYGDRENFAQGTVLFTISSTSGLPRYQSAVEESADFNWSISTLPTTLETTRVNIYGASLSILETDPESQLAAWLFIKWLTDTEQSASWSRTSNYFPVRESAADELDKYFAENPQYEKAFGFLGNDIVIEPGVASYQECRGSIEEMLEAVVVGGDPADWLADAQAECNVLATQLAPDS